jgi:hypothetical protein
MKGVAAAAPRRAPGVLGVLRIGLGSPLATRTAKGAAIGRAVELGAWSLILKF